MMKSRAKPAPIQQQVEELVAQMSEFRARLDQIVATVNKQSSQLASLNTFIEGLQEAIRLQGLSPEDQAKIDAIFAQLQANDQRIADAFTENTPPRQLP
jgi:chromosome segregation ATPase